MKLIFDSYKISDVILNGYIELVDESTSKANQKKKIDEKVQKNKKTLQLIRQALDDSNLQKN